MKTVRLLPVVIFAAAALLVFKVIGIVTDGGYVFSGTQTVLAAGGGGGHGPAPGGDAAPAEAGDGTHAMTADPTLVDASPMLVDMSPVLGEGGGGHGGGHGAPAADAHGAAADDRHDAAEADAHEERMPVSVAKPSVVDNEPVLGPGGSESEILERLSTRRQQLDGLEQELEMRAALVAAAERRLEERAAALDATEKRINALLADREATEDGAFKALVGMYETMKPKDAAAIFDQLDAATLLRVARGMNPKKMAPIMARMLPERAQQLTRELAMMPSSSVASAVSPAMEQLPQIVGQ